MIKIKKSVRIGLVILAILLFLLFRLYNQKIFERKMLLMFQERIYTEFGEKVIASIVRKEPHRECAWHLDGCMNYRNDYSQYDYEIAITNIMIPEIKAKIYYTNTYDEKKQLTVSITQLSPYQEAKELYRINSFKKSKNK